MSEFDVILEKLDAAIDRLVRAVDNEAPTIAFAREPWEKPKPITPKEGE